MDAVQHFEIPYKVRERAKKFYFDAFHWQLFDVPGTDYTLATTVDIEPNGMPRRPGAINGGLAPRSKENTAPTLLMRVTDIKAHLERIRHAGGTILQDPVPMGPVWVARFRDPEGNVMGVIQPRPEGMEPAAATGAKGKAEQVTPKANPAARKSRSNKKAKPSKSKATRTSTKTAKASSKNAKASSKGTKTPGKTAKASSRGAKPAKSKPKSHKEKPLKEAQAVWSR